MKTIEQYNEIDNQSALQKSKDKVIDALNESPLGLSLSQITTICKISAKTAKNILAILNADCENSIYSIKKVNRLEKVLAESKKPNGIEAMLKSKVTTRTVTTKEVCLTQEELKKLLAEVFNLRFVEFFEDGSVHLSEVISND